MSISVQNVAVCLSRVAAVLGLIAAAAMASAQTAAGDPGNAIERVSLQHLTPAVQIRPDCTGARACLRLPRNRQHHFLRIERIDQCLSLVGERRELFWLGHRLRRRPHRFARVFHPGAQLSLVAATAARKRYREQSKRANPQRKR